MKTTIRHVLYHLHDYEWNEWVYLDRRDVVNPTTECLVLNPDLAELGSDDFTPLEVEQHSMNEFLSIQDLRSIKENLMTKKSTVSESEFLEAVCYYFKKDAFMVMPHQSS